MPAAPKGLRLDAVFTSHLRRTAYTARAALSEAGQGHVPLQHDSRIAERSFGIFAGEPIRLLQLALGYHTYEE
jgi:broad specificity phosphatase PhoE